MLREHATETHNVPARPEDVNIPDLFPSSPGLYHLKTRESDHLLYIEQAQVRTYDPRM